MFDKDYFISRANDYLDYDIKAQLEYKWFRENYSPNALKQLSDKEILDKIFLHDSPNTMCYYIEFNSTSIDLFGSFKGGSSVNYPAYFSKSDKRWKICKTTWDIKNGTEQEVIEVGKWLIDVICKLDKFISKYDASSINYKEIYEYGVTLAPTVINKSWFFKYLHLIYPTLFPICFGQKWIKRQLALLNIKSSSSLLEDVGNINKFAMSTKLSNEVFYQVFLPVLNETKNNENYKTSYQYGLTRKAPSELTIAEHQKCITENLEGLPLEQKDKEAIVRIRVRQGKFRDKLLSKYKSCLITGIENTLLLRASHIKPFSDCNNKEAYDLDNGLLLSSIIDSLFDSGLITFDIDTGNIIYSNELSIEDKSSIKRIIKNNSIGKLNDKQKEYLKYHQEYVFKK